MKAIAPAALLVLLVGCASPTEPGLISELYSHGCDVSSYEANERLGSLKVTCRENTLRSTGATPIAVR